MLDPTLALIFNLIADIGAIACLIGMVLFVGLYSRFYQWRRRKAGKSVLYLSLSFVIISLISTLSLWIGPDYWLRPFWRMAGWLFGVFAVIYLLYALIYNWRDRNPIKVEAKTGAVPVQKEE